MENILLRLSCYGNKDAARQMPLRAWDEVEAYRKFLNIYGLTDITKLPFEELPFTDKQNYYSRWPYISLVPPSHWPSIYFMFRSSGSSGRPLYWPQLKIQYGEFDRHFEHDLIRLFQIENKPTLAIVGLALGSWIGGDLFSWALKNIALRSTYPLTVFSCGNQHEEILEIITKAHKTFKQILIFFCPSAIGHLFFLAQQSKIVLPYSKLRFITIGEPFSETLRQNLNRKCHVVLPETALASGYGTADTGAIGMESLRSIGLRVLLHNSKALREALGISETVPNLYHIYARDAYLETVEKELIITRWQGIPLIRYNLHDKSEILRWRAINNVIKDIKFDNEYRPLQALVVNNPNLPDLLAIYGRSDQTVFLCGTNISEMMLSESMQDEELLRMSSGNFYVIISEERGRQRLHWHIELNYGKKPSLKLQEFFYKTLIQRLGQLQPEFAVDYGNIYRRWDNSPRERIFDIRLYPWKMLPGKTGAIKQKVIVKAFPPKKVTHKD